MLPTPPPHVSPVHHEIDGVELRTVDVGPADATAVFVLIHGIGMSHHTFSPLAAVLKRHGRVIGVDLAGFGANRRPRRRIGLEDHARQVEQALRGLGVSHAVVVGHSMGSQVAVELGVRAPGLVDAAVLIGPVVDPERPGAVRQGLALLRDCLGEPVGVDAILLADYLRGGVRWYLRQLPEMLRYPVQERLAELEVPVLVARGRDDPIATRDWCERLTARAREGRLVEFAGSRHVVPRTEPEPLALEILRFAAALGEAPVAPLPLRAEPAA
ncbi:alpha/beta hydrolase [Rathayibacter rathayi]|uniref:alpha/beta fold hydrolase n=1 Tax=Rathayibacter rathayi TaxID=33887 RepID=UPI000CE898CF|nr:alpha/beta fold hydrolase [Rathayibacter rathayi]PPG68043.1 alpha/beta hydrolase [Rathayibacter rathayi]PPG76090.1 alpha/beta hydrolase [Rathayibacter rathayi]PPH21162.1 alpha/beta hydrolase [Rathayibacter rathayi]PPI75346.1 alpha/beta hydrolase [Rathayibacter rathayi]